ncbi:peptidoglycan/LPS O-acetylase OafA/YrhL [Kitasatospora sp. MAP12-15]|uniref:acyltransferase family protein n=1 Tax=unclassified Kitasatospora TaxID=2633591 RepID=UPI002473F56C|nr:acyltransferase [Kitasatospora sp. MAP12-44]MDH6111007.1 peptidoglycan/LPS O-acetylase OafA/YrhL [Kitasatospora sp. MAP12-44]
MSTSGFRQRLFNVPTLASSWSRENGFGLLRLLLAISVIASHSFPLGYGKADLGVGISHNQTNVGALAVAGFFVLSGLLITRSGMRLTTGRFLWHRALRLLPGLWVCLFLTAFVMAPLVAIHEKQSLSALFSSPTGPWSYLRANWAEGSTQYGIANLLGHVPHAGAFNGSLWTLRYEMAGYLSVGFLAAAAVLRRARWVVVLLMAWAYYILVSTALTFPHLRMTTYAPLHGLVSYSLPLLGPLSSDYLVPMLFMFGLGTLAELFRDRLPISGVLAAVALAVFAGTLHYGGFALFGMPALAYLLIFAAMRMPAPLNKIGSKRDYSYGLYIYAFVVQQGLAELHFARWGVVPFFLLSLAGSLVLAALSWHLVEQPALRLKNLGLARRPARRSTTPVGVEGAGAPVRSGDNEPLRT